MTNLETKADNRLREKGWLLEQQVPVLGYTLDFAHLDLKIGIEIDGWFHRQPARALRDYLRDNRLRANGWIIFRVSYEYGEEAAYAQLDRIAEVLDHFAGVKETT